MMDVQSLFKRVDFAKDITSRPAAANFKGVCIRHGAKVKTCSHEGCTNNVQNRGVCIRGAKRSTKTCSHVGCTNNVQKGGVCYSHGTCRHEGCTNQVKREEFVHYIGPNDVPY